MSNKTKPVNQSRRLLKWTKGIMKESLNVVEQKIKLGYTDENFNTISEHMNNIRPHLRVDEVKMIETHWRNSYTDSCDVEKLAEDMNYIRVLFKL